MPAYTTVSANGCRAPVDRQLLGDIAYLDIQLTGFDATFVTASEYGYFIIAVSSAQFTSMIAVFNQGAQKLSACSKRRFLCHTETVR